MPCPRAPIPRHHHLENNAFQNSFLEGEPKIHIGLLLIFSNHQESWAGSSISLSRDVQGQLVTSNWIQTMDIEKGAQTSQIASRPDDQPAASTILVLFFGANLLVSGFCFMFCATEVNFGVLFTFFFFLFFLFAALSNHSLHRASGRLLAKRPHGERTLAFRTAIGSMALGVAYFWAFVIYTHTQGD